jgi:hypothetical protein
MYWSSLFTLLLGCSNTTEQSKSNEASVEYNWAYVQQNLNTIEFVAIGSAIKLYQNAKVEMEPEVGLAIGAKLDGIKKIYQNELVIKSIDENITSISDMNSTASFALKITTMDNEQGWIDGDQLYRKTKVIKVADDDVLNVRKGLSYKSEKVAEIKPNGTLFINSNNAHQTYMMDNGGCTNEFVELYTIDKTKGNVNCSFVDYKYEMEPQFIIDNF